MRSRVKLDYDAMAREYTQHRQVDPEVLKNLISMSGLYSGSQVLDAGCGTGNYIVALQNGIGCSCWGIDPSEQMLVKAQERTNTAHLRLGRAEQLDYPDDSFDLVFSVDVIHHIRDRQAYFYKGYRVLRESGRICTVTDSEEIIRQRQPISVYFPDTVDLELQRYPRISDLRLMPPHDFSRILRERTTAHGGGFAQRPNSRSLQVSSSLGKEGGRKGGLASRPLPLVLSLCRQASTVITAISPTFRTPDKHHGRIIRPTRMRRASASY